MGLHGKHFYNSLTRKYITTFGSLFNDLQVIRYDSNGNEHNRERCPIHFGPKDKYVAKLKKDLDLERRKPQIKLPRMSFELESIEYDGPRKYNSARKIQVKESDQKTYTYQPVPYKLTFVLNLYTRGLDEMYQLMEQILPMFQPDFTVSINPLDNSDIQMNIPFNLLSMVPTDNFDGPFDENRAINWSLTFTASVDFFGPIRTGKVIYKQESNIYNQETDDRMLTVNHTPEQDGKPVEEIDFNEEWKLLTEYVFGDES